MQSPIGSTRIEHLIDNVQAAFDSSKQLVVFHRGWTAGCDADAEGK